MEAGRGVQVFHIFYLESLASKADETIHEGLFASWDAEHSIFAETMKS